MYHMLQLVIHEDNYQILYQTNKGVFSCFKDCDICLYLYYSNNIQKEFFTVKIYWTAKNYPKNEKWIPDITEGKVIWKVTAKPILV